MYIVVLTPFISLLFVFRTFQTDLRLGLFPSRKLILERNKAISHARNPGLSKYGQCLVSVNNRLNNVLKTNLASLNAEFKRMEMQATRRKKFFIKTSGLLNHEPLLLVQRPKSEPIAETPSVPRKDDNVPGFMKPRLSKIVRPSSLKTIDIYTVRPAKKTNLWESSGEERALRFTGVIRPCAKLSENEVEHLKNEYSATKPSLSFNSASKEYVITRSDLAPSSAKRKRLSGKISPDSEQDESGKGEKEDDDDDDDIGYHTEGLFPDAEEEGKHDEINTLNEPEGLSVAIPRSSSFITEMETPNKNTDSIRHHNEQREDKTEPQRKADTSADISEAEMAYASIIKDEASRTDTRQIPYHLPTVNSPVHPKQSIISEQKHKNEMLEQYPKVIEHKRIEKTITLQTKGNLSRLNVAKAGILGKVSKAQPDTRLPTKKQKTVSTTASVINKNRKDGTVRSASAKSVKFSGL